MLMTKSELNYFIALLVSLIAGVGILASNQPLLAFTLAPAIWISLVLFLTKLDQHYQYKRKLAKSAN